MDQPHAERLRPQNLDEFLGQNKILGEQSLLRKSLENNKDSIKSAEENKKVSSIRTTDCLSLTDLLRRGLLDVCVKKLFASFFFLINVVLIACSGNDSVSSQDSTQDPTSEKSSSSSQILSSSDNWNGLPPCEVEPLYSNGWPRDLGVTSSLKNIFAYGSNLGCNINLDMNSAILLVKKDDGWDTVGTIAVTSTRTNESHIEDIWEYTADFSVLDKPTPLPDGNYKLIWGDGKSLNTSFSLKRHFHEVEMTVDWDEYSKKIGTYINIDRSVSYPHVEQRGFLYNPREDKKYPLECKNNWSSWTYSCSISNEQYSSLSDGLYEFQWEAFLPDAFPDYQTYSDLLDAKYDRDEDLKWSYVVDSLGNFKEGIVGTKLKQEVYLDQTAPKILNVSKSAYSVIFDGTNRNRDFIVNAKIYDDLLGRESQIYTVSYYVRGALAHRELVDTDKDTTDLNVKFSYSTQDRWELFLKIVVEDERSYADTIKIENLDVLDSQEVSYNIGWVPEKIPSKDYDCSKYKCVITDYLNPDLEYGEFLDKRDNQVYRTTQIGDQVWFAQNLNFETDSSFCKNNELDSCAKYGRLYTWNAAVGKSMEECPYDSACYLTDSTKNEAPVRGACPEGWHVPAYKEFYALKVYVTEHYDRQYDRWGSRFLKSQHGWAEGMASNETGLSVIAAAYRIANYPNGETDFWDRQETAFWLSDGHLTSYNDGGTHILQYGNQKAAAFGFWSYRDEFPTFMVEQKTNGYPIRCLKD